MPIKASLNLSAENLAPAHTAHTAISTSPAAAEILAYTSYSTGNITAPLSPKASDNFIDFCISGIAAPFKKMLIYLYKPKPIHSPNGLSRAPAPTPKFYRCKITPLGVFSTLYW